jgi:hypothetical protein
MVLGWHCALAAASWLGERDARALLDDQPTLPACHALTSAWASSKGLHTNCEMNLSSPSLVCKGGLPLVHSASSPQELQVHQDQPLRVRANNSRLVPQNILISVAAGSTFKGMQPNLGSAVWLDKSTSTSLIDSNFSLNTISTGAPPSRVAAGRSVYAGAGAVLRLERCTFGDNIAGGGSGEVALQTVAAAEADPLQRTAVFSDQSISSLWVVDVGKAEQPLALEFVKARTFLSEDDGSINDIQQVQSKLFLWHLVWNRMQVSSVGTCVLVRCPGPEPPHCPNVHKHAALCCAARAQHHHLCCMFESPAAAKATWTAAQRTLIFSAVPLAFGNLSIFVRYVKFLERGEHWDEYKEHAGSIIQEKVPRNAVAMFIQS